MTQILLLPLMIYAACGLALSLVVHVLSFFGAAPGGETLFTALDLGIFPLWVPVVLIARKMSGGAMRRMDFWKMAMSGCPPWMRYMTYGFFIYAVINWAIFVLPMMSQPRPSGAERALHGFSGHWMVFYSAGLAIVTTSYRRGLSNLQRHCPFGHSVGWGDRFCPTCGASVAPLPEQP